MDILGIDIARLTFDATIQTARGGEHYQAFPNTSEGYAQLQAWLQAHRVTQVHACMAATNVAWETLATWLHDQGHTVSVVNPAHIKGYAQATMQRTRTDKRDSAVIASFCATHRPAAWQPLSDAQRRLRALVRHRDDLLQIRLQQQNYLLDTRDELVRESLQSLLEAVETRISAINEQIAEHVRAQTVLHTNLRLLTAIVGVGA